jgi:hypothetical protein
VRALAMRSLIAVRSIFAASASAKVKTSLTRSSGPGLIVRLSDTATRTAPAPSELVHDLECIGDSGPREAV